MDNLVLLFLIGAALLVIGLGAIELGISKKGKNFLKLGGFALCAYVVLSWSGVGLFEESAPPQSTVGATFDVTGSESHSYVTVDNLAQKFVWTVYYNSTTGAIVGATQATVNFSIDRGIGTIGLVQTYADVSYVPSVTNSTSGLSFSVVTKSNICDISRGRRVATIDGVAMRSTHPYTPPRSRFAW